MKLLRGLVAAVACAALAALAQAPQEQAQTILHLLDYIGVDYAEAVGDGRVKNADEYEEMREFTAQVAARIAELPDHPRRAALLEDAGTLAKLVADRAEPARVADASSKLRRALVEAYRLRLAPRAAPPLERARALYAQHCAACHGVEGRGDGPAAQALEPAPSDFHDFTRMAQRSAYGLYNTITLGVEGTSMASFRHLSEEDRWALAFFVSNIGVPAARVQEGARRWQAGEGRRIFPDLQNVATLSSEEITARHGEAAARIQDYLRAHPEVLRPAPIAFSRERIAESLDAYRRGDRAAARQAAIAGYLEGFELAEASLANVDAGLVREIEREMLALRAAIEHGEPVDAYATRVARVDALLAAADEKLDGDGLAPSSVFAASFLILLREGLEAILVLAAILAFVRRTGRRDALPYVHAGWIGALVLGAATWAVASFVIDISGANRELTEGITALLACAMLLYVGWWLHGKSYAAAWDRFVREQVGRALARHTLWAMAGVAFLAVYREMFEIVLFYQALWVQAGSGSHGPVLVGMVAAAAVLVVVGYAILRYSVRLPIGKFFVATSALIALLAVVLAGHGVAALQEAGVIGVTALGFEPVPLVGLYPSVETVAAQLAVLALVGAGVWSARRTASHALHAS